MAVVTGLLFLALVLLMLHKTAKHVLSSFRYRHLPGPPWAASLPLLGHGAFMLGQTIRGADARTAIRDIVEASQNDSLVARPFADCEGFRSIRGTDRDAEVLGVFFSDRSTWRDLRSFCLRELREMGMGRVNVGFEDILVQESEAIVKKMWHDSSGGTRPIEIHSRMVPNQVNMIYRLLTGHESHHSDQKLSDLARSVQSFIGGADARNPIVVLQMFSSLFCRILKGVQDAGVPCPTPIQELLRPLNRAVKTMIREAETDPEGYFIERFKARVKASRGDALSTFHEEKGSAHMLGTTVDLFGAGVETTTHMMEWLILYLAIHTDAQRAIRAQLETVLGKGVLAKPIDLDHKKRCPLVLSAIEETLRLSPMLDVNFPQMAGYDTNVAGHFIPKGTVVIRANYFAHCDSKAFPNPEEFVFDRFVDPKTGNFTGPSNRIMAFSYGKRRCLGEKMARDSLFFNIANIVQAFEFRVSDAAAAAKVDLNAIGRTILPNPRPFNLILEPTGNVPFKT